MPGWIVMVKRGMAITQKDIYDGGEESTSTSKGGIENSDKNDEMRMKRLMPV